MSKNEMIFFKKRYFFLSRLKDIFKPSYVSILDFLLCLDCLFKV